MLDVDWTYTGTVVFLKKNKKPVFARRTVRKLRYEKTWWWERKASGGRWKVCELGPVFEGKPSIILK